ncbi:OsmC family peroxiredoxin [bacterium]|nr:OsmC family peroxiredoxin [bacterium]
MKITAKRIDDAYKMEVENAVGDRLQIDGVNQGMSPMQTLLAAYAGCTVVDVVDILKKQRQHLRHLEIDISGERPATGDIKPFTAIHLHYRLYGDIKPHFADRAISLAVHTYCSVGASLNPEIKVGYSFQIEE